MKCFHVFRSMLIYTKGFSLGSAFFWFVFGIMGVFDGLIFKDFFDTLSTTHAHTGLLILLLLVKAIVVVASFHIGGIFYEHQTFRVGALLRKNLISYILKKPGAQALPFSMSRAVSQFREDINQLTDFVGQYSIAPGYTLSAIIHLIILYNINARMTLILFIPFFIILIIMHYSTSKIQNNKKVYLQTTEEVTGFIGDTFQYIQTVQVGGLEDRILHRFQVLCLQRKENARQESVFEQILRLLSTNIIQLGVGATLLTAAGMIKDGTFTLGDFSIFVSYMGILPNAIADWKDRVVKFKQSSVSVERLEKLMDGPSYSILLKHVPLFSKSDEIEIDHESYDKDCLDQLEVNNLTYQYPNGATGVYNINFSLKKGSLTVITGAIGSGKTTLLRTMTGLVSPINGEIRWNKKLISEPSTFFIPPKTAYTPQMPTLFSTTITENIFLDKPVSTTVLHSSIKSSMLEQDIKQQTNGVETVLGSKGINLSGGQIQRLAAARMFARNPELFIVDDLSSALDIETEIELLKKLRERNSTYLVVSQRKTAFLQADHIIVMKNGEIESQGSLQELLDKSDEMKLLWGTNDKGES